MFRPLLDGGCYLQCGNIRVSYSVHKYWRRKTLNVTYSCRWGLNTGRTLHSRRKAVLWKINSRMINVRLDTMQIYFFEVLRNIKNLLYVFLPMTPNHETRSHVARWGMAQLSIFHYFTKSSPISFLPFYFNMPKDPIHDIVMSCHHNLRPRNLLEPNYCQSIKIELDKSMFLPGVIICFLLESLNILRRELWDVFHIQHVV